MMRLTTVLLAFVLLPLAACTVEEADVVDPAQEEADLQAIERINELWDEANLAGDVEAFLELITDDYIRMNPDQPMIVGKQAFVAVVGPFLEKYAIQESNNVADEIRIADDWAYVRGSYEGVIVPKAGGDPVTINGKWIDIRERQSDGTWKISRASVSNDLPVELPE